MSEEKKEIIITVKKVENGFLLSSGDKLFVAERKYDLRSLFDALIEQIEKKEESDD